jgi:hypothetical protein
MYSTIAGIISTNRSNFSIFNLAAIENRDFSPDRIAVGIGLTIATYPSAAQKSSMDSWNYRKSSPPVRPKAKDREIIVERSRALDREPTHDCETCSIDDRKVLVTIGDSDLPGGFQVCYANCLKKCNTLAQPFPESLCCMAADTMSKQRPRLDQDVIGCYQLLAAGKNRFRAGIAFVRCVRCCEPDRGIDKETHDNANLSAAWVFARRIESLRSHNFFIVRDVRSSRSA